MPRLYKCPFFHDDRRGRISCEGGSVKLGISGNKEYATRFCANNPGWRECPFARELSKKYGSEETQNEA